MKNRRKYELARKKKPTKPTIKLAQYYKALTVDGKGPYELRTKYSLPSHGVYYSSGVKPGLWHTVAGKLEMCANGLHVATPKYIRVWVPQPQSWQLHADAIAIEAGTLVKHAPTRRVFAAEVLKGTERLRHRDKDKVCVRMLRLVREVPYGSAEWLALGLFVDPAVDPMLGRE
jgi:hypothetical protein